MFEKDRIERGLWWDQALNLVYGCSEHITSEGCRNCWSMREAHMRKSNPNPKIKALFRDLTDNNGKWTGNMYFMDENLQKPLKRKKPTVYAVWNDLFKFSHRASTFGSVDESVQTTINTMIKCKQHLFIVPTKQPKEMARVLDHMIIGNQIRNGIIDINMPNIFWGTTVESPAYIGRISDMQPDRLLHSEMQKGLKFVLSIEPLLERIPTETFLPYFAMNLVKWVIVGGESGPGSRPMDPDWAREIRDMCKDYKIPFFFKQMGGHPSKRNYFKDIPEDLRIRELPIVGEQNVSKPL